LTNHPLRIGTRDSKLALWQANAVRKKLEILGQSCVLVPVKSPGDLDLTTPLHQFGSTGIFTKVLDLALEENQIDIAVHSLKDYPTQIPQGLVLPAVLERGAYHDVLIPKNNGDFLENLAGEAIIATGSIRRIAQWKSRYPKHQSTNLRGNVQTRLRKLDESNWQGAIFAKAGLERIGLLPTKAIELDWMIPAPAQGTVGIACRANDSVIIKLLEKINDPLTFLRAKIEREFLNKVEGGCSAPVGALTLVQNDNIMLTAGVFALNGSTKVVATKKAPIAQAENLGLQAAEWVLKNGGTPIMQSINNG
jgi:hydroxymethylbilane synthase